MERQVTTGSVETSSKVKSTGFVLGLGAVLLFAVFYIHLALFLTLIGVNRMLGVLFLINALGSLIALIGVLNRARWWGWVLGIVMAAGAAVIKLAMDMIPSFAAFLLGIHAGSGVANHPHPHVLTATVIPTFTNLKALGTIAIVIELVFVLCASFALRTKRQTDPSDR